MSFNFSVKKCPNTLSDVLIFLYMTKIWSELEIKIIILKNISTKDPRVWWVWWILGSDGSQIVMLEPGQYLQILEGTYIFWRVLMDLAWFWCILDRSWNSETSSRIHQIMPGYSNPSWPSRISKDLYRVEKTCYPS